MSNINKPVTPEHWLRELAAAKLDGPEFNRILWTDDDTQYAELAYKKLEERNSEVDGLNKLCDKLDAENGKLKAEIARHDAETAEWKITIRQLQDNMDDLQRKTLHIDRVRDVLYMLQFALEAGKRAFAMPVEVCNLLDGIWEEARHQLLYQPDDDIPF